jgi:hypothetical protein
VDSAEEIVRGWFAWRLAQPKPLKSRTALASRVAYVCRLVAHRGADALLDPETWDGINFLTRGDAMPRTNPGCTQSAA